MLAQSDALPDLRALKLVLTAGCNLRCSYCYQSDKQNRRIEWDVVRPAIDRLLASKREDLDVLFIGGEPLLEFPTIRETVAYIEQHKRRGVRMRYAMITNGLLLGEEQRDFLLAHGFHVQLSFDGVPAAQRLRGEHTFERLDRLLDDLRDREPAFYDNKLRVNITLVPDTIPWLAESVEYFLIDKRLQDLRITASITSTGWRVERIHELEQAFRRIYRISLRRYRETGEIPLSVFQKSGHRAVRPKQLSMCGVGRGDQIAVDVDGQTHGCLTFAQSYQTFPTVFLRSRVEAMRMGDIRDAEFDQRREAYPAAVRAAEIFHHKEQKYSSYGRCGNCKYLAHCGVCPMSIGRTEGETDPLRVPDFNCAYNLVSLKYRARFPRLRPLAERLAGPRGFMSALMGR